MRRIVLTPAVTAACVAGALLGAPDSSATAECQGVSTCATVTGPWVAVPVASDPTDYGALYTGYCPPGSVVRGSDWLTEIPTHASYLDIYAEQVSGMPIYGSDSLSFIAVNRVRKSLSFQPLLGCGSPGAARVGAGASAQSRSVGCSITDPRCTREHRLAVHDLGPGRSFEFTHRCPKGRRLVSAGSSVAFRKKKAPSRRELRELEVARTERRGAHGSTTVRIRTGRHVGDDERVQAQVHTFCA